MSNISWNQFFWSAIHCSRYPVQFNVDEWVPLSCSTGLYMRAKSWLKCSAHFKAPHNRKKSVSTIYCFSNRSLSKMNLWWCQCSSHVPFNHCRGGGQKEMMMFSKRASTSNGGEKKCSKCDRQNAFILVSHHLQNVWLTFNLKLHAHLDL